MNPYLIILAVVGGALFAVLVVIIVMAIRNRKDIMPLTEENWIPCKNVRVWVYSDGFMYRLLKSPGSAKYIVTDIRSGNPDMFKHIVSITADSEFKMANLRFGQNESNYNIDGNDYETVYKKISDKIDEISKDLLDEYYITGWKHKSQKDKKDHDDNYTRKIVCSGHGKKFIISLHDEEEYAVVDEIKKTSRTHGHRGLEIQMKEEKKPGRYGDTDFVLSENMLITSVRKNIRKVIGRHSDDNEPAYAQEDKMIEHVLEMLRKEKK